MAACFRTVRPGRDTGRAPLLMDYRTLHSWDVTPAEALRLQGALRALVATRDDFPAAVRTIAGMDVSYDCHSPWLFAAVVVLRAQTCEIVDQATAPCSSRR